ncbi:hypothetical protein ACFSL6_17820 [Paenibacillus thailandensis]|uniref:HAD family hydrolase n=1 Tax=Paenibacillus thailandensis TaxID=393250 RepID=A0ABW5R382_9BACL
MSEITLQQMYNKVREFHTAFGEDMPEKPTELGIGKMVTNNWLIGSLHSLTQEIKAVNSQKFEDEQIGGKVGQRISFMLEELTEFAAADDVVEQADALIDLIYFAIGTFTLIGVNPAPLFEIVHEANMGKVGPDGKVLRDSQGKIVKPAGWKERYAPEPRIRAEIERQAIRD